MDLFTRSVDPTLWSSRAFDDPFYDHDPTAAAEALSPITYLPTPTPLPTTLVLSVGPAATAALHALSTPPYTSLTTLSGAGVAPITLVTPVAGSLSHCTLAYVDERDVPAARAPVWAAALLDAAKPQRVLVLTAQPRAARRGGGTGLRMLRTSAWKDSEEKETEQREGGIMEDMREPEFVEGCAAAVVGAVEVAGGVGGCLVQVLERARFGVDDCVQLARALGKVLQRWDLKVEVGKGLVDAVREAVGSRGGEAHDSIYM